MSNLSHNMLSYLRVMVGACQKDQRDDSELIARFAGVRDEGAFAALVYRHGPLVWQTCQRILGDTPDAEDAFQATFLALARKAGSFPVKSLAGWLHRAARQTALNADAEARRRRSLEQRLGTVKQPESEGRDADRAELYAALDDELAGLPEKLRVPLLLRYLEGKSQDEVARILGWTRAMVRRRLARGETILRERLTGRGLAVGAVVALLTNSATVSAVPSRLIGGTSRAAVVFRSGALTGKAAEAALAVLGALPASFLETTIMQKSLLWIVLACCLGLAGVSLVACRAFSARPGGPAAASPAATQATERPGPSGRAAVRLDRLGDPLPEGAVARLGTVRLYYPGEISDVAFSPDGKTVAVGGNDKTVRLCEVATGKEIRTLHGHEGNIRGIAFSPDGKTVTSVDEFGMVRLCEVVTGKEIRTFLAWTSARPRQPVRRWWVRSMACSPDGKTLAMGGQNDGGLRLWETATGKEIRSMWGHQGRIRSIAFSPDGKTIAAGEDETVCLWDAATSKEIRILRGGEGLVFAVAFSPDSKTVTSVWQDGLVRIWEVTTGKPVCAFKGHEGSAWSAVFSPDGKTVATVGGLDGAVRLWETATGKPIRALLLGGRHSRWVKKVAFSPDGKTIASGGMDGVVHLWEATTGKPIRTLQGHDGWVRAVTFLPDGKTVATEGEDGAARLWEAATGKPIRTLQGHKGGVGAAAFSPDGKMVASGGMDGTVRLWESATGKEIRILKSRKEWVLSMAFSPDSKILAAGGDRTVGLLDSATGKEICVLHAHKGLICSVAFSPDGKTVAIPGGEKKTVSLFEAVAGKEVRRVQQFVPLGDTEVCSVAFSPDGKIMATGERGRANNGMVRLREVATGGEICILQGHKGKIGKIGAVTFSQDSRTLAATSGDCIQLWTLPSGTALPTLAGHRGEVLGVAFSSDGRTLASVSADTTGLIWKLTHRAALPATKLDPDALKVLWTDLASEDAARAWRAVWTLAATPSQSVPLLRDHLGLVPAPDSEQLARLIANLDTEDFKARQKAYQELEKLGAVAAPALRKSLEGSPSLEQRRRLKQLLEAVEARMRFFSENVFLGLRAVAVLEQVGTPEAREVLKTLATGAAGVRLKQDAQSALSRLDGVKRP